MSTTYTNHFRCGSYVPTFHIRVGQKLVRLGALQWAPPEQLFAVFSKNTDFPKKLFNMKKFSSKFVMKKVI